MFTILRFFFKRLGGSAPAETGLPSTVWSPAARGVVWSAPARGVVWTPPQQT